MTQSAPQQTTTTTTAILAEIEKRSGVDLAATGIPDHCAWFPPPGGNAALVFAIGEPLPINTTYTVAFLFQDESEVRVYVAPNPTANPNEPQWLRCYTLSKSTPVYFCEKLMAEAFIQAVSDEWVLKAEGQTSAEREREMVLEHLEAFEPEPGVTAKEAVAALHDEIEAGDHLEEDDEEETLAPGPNGTEAPSAGAPTEPAPAPSVTPAAE